MPPARDQLPCVRRRPQRADVRRALQARVTRGVMALRHDPSEPTPRMVRGPHVVVQEE